MKQMLKRRIAIMLSLLFVLPNVLGLLPMATLQTEAASMGNLSWFFYRNEAVQVEEGKAFYVGDYVSTYSEGKVYTHYTASMLKASYKSSDATVASVNNKGYMTTLKPGKTTITVTYKGKSTSKEFEVVKKGTFGTLDEATKLATAAQKLPSKMPSSITTKNGLKYVKLLSTYMKVEDEVSQKISIDGLLKEEVKYGPYTYYSATNKLVVPEAGRRYTLNRLLSTYETKNSPTSTRSAKVLKLSSASASAKKNAITLTFKKSVSKEQILAAKIYEEVYCSDILKSSKLNKKQAYVRVSVYNKKAVYEGVAKITQGKKTATMQIYNVTYGTGKAKYTKQKIKKGQTYTLGNKANEWAKGKKVKAK
ncbi:MAG: Ig-like domain-containing protein [Lachnospiraceae bacterium]|nr:Ig-like domain-containing protein [Lachnospiraceae bacterium]